MFCSRGILLSSSLDFRLDPHPGELVEEVGLSPSSGTPTDLLPEVSLGVGLGSWPLTLEWTTFPETSTFLPTTFPLFPLYWQILDRQGFTVVFPGMFSLYLPPNLCLLLLRHAGAPSLPSLRRCPGPWGRRRRSTLSVHPRRVSEAPTTDVEPKVQSVDSE